jgi:hypothetical protein
VAGYLEFRSGELSRYTVERILAGVAAASKAKWKCRQFEWHQPDTYVRVVQGWSQGTMKNDQSRRLEPTLRRNTAAMQNKAVVCLRCLVAQKYYTNPYS